MRKDRRRRFFSLFAGLVLTVSTFGFAAGTASADPIPHTVCLGGNGESHFSPPLDLIPSPTDFSANTSDNVCLGAVLGTVRVVALFGDGLLSCELSLVDEGRFLLDWDGAEEDFSVGDVVLATNVSKGILFKLNIEQGHFAGQSATLLVESLANPLPCILGGLEEIQGPTQLAFGI